MPFLAADRIVVGQAHIELWASAFMVAACFSCETCSVGKKDKDIQLGNKC